MKFFAVIAAALLLVTSSARAQQSPDDQYVIIYVLIQQGDAYVNAGQAKQALSEYVEAQTELQKFQQVYGDWNPAIVKFRLQYLADRIAALTPETTATTNTATSVVVTPPPTPADWQAQLATLNAQIQHMQGDNQTLQSKLKEALSAQPAAVSADQLAQVQQQVIDLTKENDLLKATVAQLTNSAPVRASQNNTQLQAALIAETARAAQLAAQNQTLQLRVQSLATDASSADALRQENALLKKQLAGVGVASAAVSTSGDAAERAQITQLQADVVADALEKEGLENRMRQMQEATLNGGGAPATVSEANLQSRINELTLERDNLLGQLGEANKKLYGRNNQSTAAQIDALGQQVDTLRARVAVDEAPAVPYTAQELALFTPGPITANPDAEKKSIRELPSGSSVLVAEAQSYFTNREYDMAAADYQKILQHDPNNPLALANLAAIELEENKTADADKHIQAALAQQPNDPYNLTILGRVKFNEQDYDGALNALDRAAKLDPQNPQIQNFLGVALAQKGMRVQAETSFRKAVQINPDYGDAHKNLAIIYLSANPPMVELARWHYEKALASGVPPNTDLEQMLNAAGSQK